MNHPWKPQAVMLAAGLGTRLGTRTAEIPKCMVSVGGEPMIARAIRALESAGIGELVIVTGYKREVIEAYVRGLRSAVRCELVYNPEYATTNNIVSLWAARGVLRGDVLLLESDLVLSDELLAGLMSPSAAAIAEIEPWMNGTVVSLDGEGRIDGMYLREEVKPDRVMYKTVNAYSIDAGAWHGHVLPGLEAAVRSGDTGAYYEKVFAGAIRAGSLRMRGVLFDNRRWYEVDSPDDLAEAERRLRALRGGGSRCP